MRAWTESIRKGPIFDRRPVFAIKIYMHLLRAVKFNNIKLSLLSSATDFSRKSNFNIVPDGSIAYFFIYMEGKTIEILIKSLYIALCLRFGYYVL